MGNTVNGCEEQPIYRPQAEAYAKTNYIRVHEVIQHHIEGKQKEIDALQSLKNNLPEIINNNPAAAGLLINLLNLSSRS